MVEAPDNHLLWRTPLALKTLLQVLAPQTFHLL
jgi:hypothetical protein